MFFLDRIVCFRLENLMRILFKSCHAGEFKTWTRRTNFHYMIQKIEDFLPSFSLIDRTRSSFVMRCKQFCFSDAYSFFLWDSHPIPWVAPFDPQLSDAFHWWFSHLKICSATSSFSPYKLFIDVHEHCW